MLFLLTNTTSFYTYIWHACDAHYYSCLPACYINLLSRDFNLTWCWAMFYTYIVLFVLCIFGGGGGDGGILWFLCTAHWATVLLIVRKKQRKKERKSLCIYLSHFASCRKIAKVNLKMSQLPCTGTLASVAKSRMSQSNSKHEVEKVSKTYRNMSDRPLFNWNQI